MGVAARLDGRGPRAWSRCTRCLSESVHLLATAALLLLSVALSMPPAPGEDGSARDDLAWPVATRPPSTLLLLLRHRRAAAGHGARCLQAARGGGDGGSGEAESKRLAKLTAAAQSCLHKRRMPSGVRGMCVPACRRGDTHTHTHTHTHTNTHLYYI